MMTVFKIALRNLFRQKRRSLYTAISIIVGSTLLSLSIALAEGGYGNVIEMFTRGFTGHIQIHSEDYLDRPGLYKNFEYDQKIIKLIKSNEKIQSHSPRVHTGALAFINKKTMGVAVIGVDPKLEEETTTLKAKLGEGCFFTVTSEELPHNEVVIGHGVAKVLKAKLGSQLVLIGQAADGSVANDLFKVVGIMSKKSDSTEKMKCYMHIYKAQEFLVMPKKIHEISLVLDSYKDAELVSKELQNTVDTFGQKELKISPWQKVEEAFYKSMQADKAGNNVMFVIITLIVALGVLNTVTMSILERTREFGVMKALGTRPFSISFMIILETFILSIIAATVATVTGALVNWPFVSVGINYSSPVSIGGITLDGIKSDWLLEAFTTPFAVVVITAVVVSIIPAIKAALVKPVEAMRTY